MRRRSCSGVVAIVAIVERRAAIGEAGHQGRCDEQRRRSDGHREVTTNVGRDPGRRRRYCHRGGGGESAGAIDIDLVVRRDVVAIAFHTPPPSHRGISITLAIIVDIVRRVVHRSVRLPLLPLLPIVVLGAYPAPEERPNEHVRISPERIREA